MVPAMRNLGKPWNVPAPGAEGLTYGQYHAFTESGIAEFGGGALLILGGLGSFHQIPCTLILLLLAVTPANVHTNIARSAGSPKCLIPYPDGHHGRGVVQCVLPLF
jgi:uncharacterized membrane protein